MFNTIRDNSGAITQSDYWNVTRNSWFVSASPQAIQILIPDPLKKDASDLKKYHAIEVDRTGHRIWFLEKFSREPVAVELWDENLLETQKEVSVEIWVWNQGKPKPCCRFLGTVI